MVGVMAFLTRVLAMLKLAAADAVDGTLTGAKLGLFKNNFIPGKNTLIADLTPADFTGYALSAAITWATPAVSGETQLPYMAGDMKSFTCSGGDEQTIYGYYLESADGTPILLAARRFDTPIIVAAGNVLAVVPRVALDDDMPIPAGDVVLH